MTNNSPVTNLSVSGTPDSDVQPKPEADDGASQSGGIHQNKTGQNLSDVTNNTPVTNLSDSGTSLTKLITTE